MMRPRPMGMRPTERPGVEHFRVGQPWAPAKGKEAPGPSLPWRRSVSFLSSPRLGSRSALLPQQLTARVAPLIWRPSPVRLRSSKAEPTRVPGRQPWLFATKRRSSSALRGWANRFWCGCRSPCRATGRAWPIGPSLQRVPDREALISVEPATATATATATVRRWPSSPWCCRCPGSSCSCSSASHALRRVDVVDAYTGAQKWNARHDIIS